ncbi:Clr6 histone deacetylase associated PHD protein-2 Cph2 [Taxawa tesnikishii (nom. ined.)]|nr:Clr6 histone deacetylase associated PHD protein-2 Cph2 [Dothideales sp. JES 119]
MQDDWHEKLPDLAGGGVPHTTDDWEDWLRWDPNTTNEPVSPESSTKTSSNDSPIQGLSFPDLNNAYSNNDFAGNNPDFGKPAGLASGNPADPSPFVFGADDALQPIVDHLREDLAATRNTPWPILPTQDQAQDALLSPYATGHLGTPSSDKIPPLSGAIAEPATAEMSAMSSSASQPRTSISSVTTPEPVKKRAGRKRKSSTEDEGKGSSVKDNESPDTGEPPVKKTSHNVIEKRYRNNLNDKIAELRDSVPSLRAMSRPNGDGDESEDLEGLTPAHKLNKATVLAKATEYIKHLEKRNKSMVDDMAALKSRLQQLEKAVQKSSVMQSRQAAASTAGTGRSNRDSMSQGVVVPSQRGMHFANQQQYMQQHAQPAYETHAGTGAEGGQPQYVNPQGGNSFMSKLMVGSMAGLMVMEGFHEQEQSGSSTSGRGLFAAPSYLFKRGMHVPDDPVSSFGALSSGRLSLLKAFLVTAALPCAKRKSTPRPRLTAAPSLASPVEVRRKAWQTAVQSVWIPRHFLLEVVSVTAKIITLSLRHLVGPERYAAVTGLNKYDEAARIKAWDIAIDAQLAGGDAEVSYYRLLLTLMASGTLADSPVRLMQKAVHFRIFFWEMANAGYGNLFVFKDVTAKVGRTYWNRARSQQRALAAGKDGVQDAWEERIEPLPPHLAALVELECENVLTDEMIQRAYNLAWNRPSAEKTVTNPTMDSVVADHAIRSPLDAVAAWFTNRTIDAVLARSLDLDAEEGVKQEVAEKVKLAVSTAPPASGTQTRALVLQSVLIDSDREASIAAALDSLPSQPSLTSSSSSSSPSSSSSLTTTTTGGARTAPLAMPLNLVNHNPVSPDIRTALTLAKLLSLSSPTVPTPARVHAATTLLQLRLPPSAFTLLTAVAAYRVLAAFAHDKVLFNAGKVGLEDVATSLRVWAGGKGAGD